MGNLSDTDRQFLFPSATAGIIDIQKDTVKPGAETKVLPVGIASDAPITQRLFIEHDLHGCFTLQQISSSVGRDACVQRRAHTQAID